MTTIKVIDRATAPLRGLESKFRNLQPGLLIAGRAVSNLLRRHYRDKNTNEPNKLGGTRQNFWLGVAHAVNNPRPTGPASVVVSISHPAIMQKIKGGMITAKRVKNLAIPLKPESYGRAPSVLEHSLGIKLFVVKKFGRLYLAGKVENRANSVIRIFYALKRSVNQKPDPTALPQESIMSDTAKTAFGKWLMGTYS